jgi:UDPglucose--hexose-1-phosphate uridylyltransferase
MNELRRDPISGRWTIIEKREKINFHSLLKNKPAPPPQEPGECPFCEGNEHKTPPETYAIRKPGTAPNTPGWDVRVIPDHDPVLQPHGPLESWGYGIYDIVSGIGVHEILIEHPAHFSNVPDFSATHMEKVLQTVQARILAIKKDPRFRYVLLHKNYGEASGTTLEHAYSHILATPITPTRVKIELENAKAYFNFKERCIYCDLVHMEMDKKERMVLEDGVFLAITPFASHRPFEIWILPEEHETFFEQNEHLPALAETLIEIFRKIRDVLGNPDYIMTLHNGPNISASRRRGYWKTIHQDFHWHIEIVPRLHSYSSFEMGSGFSINPVPPEIAARILVEEIIPGMG